MAKFKQTLEYISLILAILSTPVVLYYAVITFDLTKRTSNNEDQIKRLDKIIVALYAQDSVLNKQIDLYKEQNKLIVN